MTPPGHQEHQVPRSWLLTLVCVLLIQGSAWGEAVHLAWDPNPEGGVAGYHVYRSLTPGGPYTRLTTLPLQTTNYFDDAAETGRTQYYTVTAVNGDGAESAFAREVSITLGRFDPVPRGTAVLARTLPDVIAYSGDLVVLSGIAHNPEVKGLSYFWIQIPVTTVPITGKTKLEASFTAPYVSQDTLLTFILLATDSDGYTVTDTLRVTVRQR